MKTICLLSVLLLLDIFVSFSQSPVVSWQHMYGGSSTELAGDFKRTIDGGLIVCGSGKSHDGDLDGNGLTNNFWVFKVDANHNTEWSKTYGGSGEDIPNSICSTTDGGYIVAGVSNSNDGDVSGHHGSTNESDCWVVKLDMNGSLEWQKSLGGTMSEAANMVIQTTDGNYMVVGDAASADGDVVNNPYPGNSSFWIVKLSASGNLISQKIYGGTKTDKANAIQPLKNGQFIIAGQSFSKDGDVTGHHDATTTSDAWVIKTNAAGNILWETSLGGSKSDEAYAVFKTKNGGFIVAGYAYSAIGGNHGEADYYLWNLSATGAILWQHAYGGTGTDIAYDVELLKDGSFLLSGTSLSLDGDINDHIGNDPDYADYWIIKTDASGNKLWTKSMGGTANDEGRSAHAMPDGSIFCLGTSGSIDVNGTGNHSFDDDLLLLQLGTVSVNTIGEAILSDKFPCWEDSLFIDFISTGSFLPGNVFTAQVTKINGNFTDMITVGTLNSATPGPIPIFMPADLKEKIHEFRVISSNPEIYGLVGTDDSAEINLTCKQPKDGIQSGGITATSAVLSWDAIGGCTDSYIVKWKPDLGGTWTYINTDTNQLALTGLAPNTKYDWGLQSLCVVSPLVSSNYCPMKYFTTKSLRLSNSSTELKIYPDPAHNFLTVELDGTGECHVVILNILGKVILNEYAAAPQMLIDISEWENGVYFLKSTTESNVLSNSFVKE
jgi:hypothetical protein